MTARFHRSALTRGVSLVEIVIAVSVVALSLGALFATFSASVGLAASQRQTAAATTCIVGRFEQIRAGSWSQITSPERIQQSILNSASPSAPLLPGLVEEITVSEYPASTPPATPIRVRRDANGGVEIVSRPSGGTLLGRAVVRIDVRTIWTGTGSRVRMRESSTVVALGGIGK